MTVRKGTKYVVSAILAILLLLFIAENVFGQSGEFSVSAWATSDRCYQHSMEGKGKISQNLWRLRGEGFLKFKWWGACDAKIPSSILNAENGKVVQRKHGVNLLIKARNFYLGGSVRRNSVHHIWRHAERNGRFPPSNDAEIAQQECRSGGTCATIGYIDGVRPLGRYKNQNLRVEVVGPPYIWKEVTLPWSNWHLNAKYKTAPWVVDANLRYGGLRETTVDFGLKRNIYKNVYIEGRYGNVQSPGWKDSLRRASLSIDIEI